jgi:GT2 family glycosyltransferase
MTGDHTSPASPLSDENPEPSRRAYVVVLNWNGWRDTVDCLTSLQALDYKNRHILVLDNGSTNDSLQRIRERSSNAEVIQLPQNLGFAGGCNVGIRLALAGGAHYVWLLNNDTKVHPGALRAMVQMAETDSRIGAVGSVIYDMSRPRSVLAWGGGRVSLWFGRSDHYTAETSSRKLAYLTGASLLLRREALEDVGLLDEGFFMYWEDADLCFRLRKAGWKLAVASESRVWHKEKASLGKASSIRDVYLWTSMVRFCDRHAPVSAIPTVIATVRMITKRVLQLQLAQAAQLGMAVAAGLSATKAQRKTVLAEIEPGEPAGGRGSYEP